jgi:proteasome lid subunit RPN8/RPN11
MTLVLSTALLGKIAAHGEQAYPDEGAGFLLGTGQDDRVVHDLVFTANKRELPARSRRYLIDPQEYMAAEIESERLGLELVGVFHSHPDHPNAPSDYDREWAQPLFSYVITSIEAGKAGESKSWRLDDDSRQFVEERIRITD